MKKRGPGPVGTRVLFMARGGAVMALVGGSWSVCCGQLMPFLDEAAERGLVYPMQNYGQFYGLQGFGCGFADFDSDGDPDVVLLGAKFTTTPPVIPPGKVGIFENDGTGHFTDRSNTCGIALLPEGSAFAAADYDGDGLQDLYITQVAPLYSNKLYRNLGNFTFEDVTMAAGVHEVAPSQGPSWGDFDGDGWLDLHVPSYNGAYAGEGGQNNDRLFRNQGDGTFVDVAVGQGVALSNGLGFQSVWFDYDRDGDVDLYLSQDRGHQAGYVPNKLWRNDGGTLVDVSTASGAGVALFSMGLACGDFDGNGWPDLYVTNIAGYAQGYNRLLLNNGNGTFTESSAQTGVDHWITSWGCVFFDFDNDGNQDLYVNNQFAENTMYHNSGTFPCTVVTAQINCEGPVGVGPIGKDYNSAVADVDGDGDVDLLLNSLGQNIQLYINPHNSPQQRWVKFNVAGEHPNLFAVGANVDTRIGDSWRFREVMAGGNGYLGQNELTIHVGAGSATIADEVVVSWPGGKQVRTFTNVATNRTWTLYPLSRFGDADGDGWVGLDDFWAYAGCHGNPVAPGCEMMDYDGDFDVDLVDFYFFTIVYSEPLEDCDEDGLLDLEQILLNPGLDKDQNGVLDACSGEPGDINGDGVVNVDDLLLLIAAWGPCADCPADQDGNGVVNVDDLLFVINHWG